MSCRCITIMAMLAETSHIKAPASIGAASVGCAAQGGRTQQGRNEGFSSMRSSNAKRTLADQAKPENLDFICRRRRA